MSGRFGWKELARQIPIRCFMFDPTINSSLKFPRQTPWARAKVEEIAVSCQQSAVSQCS
ncbi:MAG TPA: VF530 family DNA-binding protein [Candidatus Didemnitutus sp.]|nr:VF530 family DNA-binding protein [Candidatus Didemnitutus sp.]